MITAKQIQRTEQKLKDQLDEFFRFQFRQLDGESIMFSDFLNAPNVKFSGGGTQGTCEVIGMEGNETLIIKNGYDYISKTTWIPLHAQIYLAVQLEQTPLFNWLLTELNDGVILAQSTSDNHQFLVQPFNHIGTTGVTVYEAKEKNGVYFKGKQLTELDNCGASYNDIRTVLYEYISDL